MKGLSPVKNPQNGIWPFRALLQRYDAYALRNTAEALMHAQPRRAVCSRFTRTAPTTARGGFITECTTAIGSTLRPGARGNAGTSPQCKTSPSRSILTLTVVGTQGTLLAPNGVSGRISEREFSGPNQSGSYSFLRHVMLILDERVSDCSCRPLAYNNVNTFLYDCIFVQIALYLCHCWYIFAHTVCICKYILYRLMMFHCSDRSQ